MSTCSASQIARASGRSARAVAYQLERVPAAGQVDTDGRPASTWTMESLPVDLQGLIIRRAMRRGHPDAKAYLAACREPWRLPVPPETIAKEHFDKAARVQRVLMPPLKARENESTPRGETERMVQAAWHAEFGYPITPRHARRLLQRTEDRDGGDLNWMRLEIFLDDAAFAPPPAPRPAIARELHLHRELDEVFEALENRTAPTLHDRQYLFDAAFRHYESRTDALLDSPEHDARRRAIKASLVHYICAAFAPGTFARTEKALRRLFDKKLARWRESNRDPEALADQRPEKSGKFGLRLCPKCRPLVVGGAVDLDGDVSQAWRRLQLSKQLCAVCVDIGSFDVRNRKSEVPKSVRSQVMPEILSALAERRGTKHKRLVSPCVRRDWSDIGPGFAIECDDVTWNHATHSYVEVLTWETGRDGRPYVGRMECLVAIDRRTDYPWAFIILLGEPAGPGTPQLKAHYSSVHPRLLMLRAHDELGIPHHGGEIVLENGIWRSRLIDGPRVSHWSSNPWQRTEMGLKDPRIGLTIRHTLPGNPRSKVIERVFLSIQNRTRCQPGFLGFNERTDKRERVDEFIRRVKAGKEHPGNELLHTNEFRKLLETELMAHANEPQNGNRLPGMSPAEAFLNGIDGHPGIKERPLRQFAANARFLLSTHERRLKVGSQGIVFKIGSTPYVFWGPELEPWQHREVIVRFNIEEPDMLTCQAPEGEPFIVKARILPSSTATKEQLAETARSRASWMRRGKVIYDNLPHPFRATITRDNEQSEQDRELGRFHNEEVKKFRAEKSVATRKLRKVQEAAASAGIQLTRVNNPDEALDALERREMYRRRAVERERLADTANATPGSGPKIYTLKPFIPEQKTTP
jgi:hypothetical protein